MSADAGDIVLYSLPDGSSVGELRPALVVAARDGLCNLLVFTDRANDAHPPMLWRDQVPEGTTPGRYRRRDSDFLTASDARALLAHMQPDGSHWQAQPADPTVTELPAPPQTAAEIEPPQATAPPYPAAHYLTQTTEDDLHHDPAY